MSYIGNTPSETFHTATSQVFNGDGSTTAFTLEKRVNRAEDLEVFVNNIQQQPTVAYSANNTTLTFTEAPDSATGNIYVVYRMFAQENTFNAIHDFTDEVTFNGNVNYKDNVEAKFGNDSDLKIFHTGSNSIIQDAGTGNLQLRGHAVRIANVAGTKTGLQYDQGQGIQLFYDTTQRLETDASGVKVTGRIEATSHINLNNSSGYGRVEIGGSSGAFIDLKSPFSDDFDNRIITVGDHRTLQIQSDNLILTTRLGNAKYLDGVVNGGVSIYHNNSKKFETTSSGVTITGSILPSADDTHDLGSSSAQWRDIYTGDINLNNTKTRDNEVDGTRGSWTIQEGEDDLFLINRLNGKKYKFKLEEM